MSAHASEPRPITSLSSRRMASADPDSGRPTTVKFPLRDFEILEALAFAQQSNVSEQIRVALRDYFLLRLNDPDLREHIERAKKRIVEQSEELLACLDGQTDPAAVPMQPIRKQESSKDSKPHTLRLEAGTINRLTALALVDLGSTMADHIRYAVTRYIEHTVENPERLVKTHKEARATMRAFAGPSKEPAAPARRAAETPR